MTKDRLTQLDGLRGLAALLVLIGHVAEEANKLVPSLWLDLTLDWVGFGRIGVVAFFCISGFVIPYSFRPIRPVRTFMISRFFRLYPAFWLSLALAALLMGPIDWAVVAANATMAPILLGQPDVVSVYWTLFIELVFYGICLALFVTGHLRRSASVIMAAMAFLGLAATAAMLRAVEAPVQPPAGIPAYLGIMLFGTVWRRAWLDADPLARRAMPWLTAAVVVTIAVVGFFAFDGSNMPQRPFADFLGVYVGLALFFGSFRFAGALARPTMIWLGDISYSLYLLHALVVLACSLVAQKAGSPVLAIAALALSLPLSLLAAHWSTRLVEKPAIRFGRYVSKRRVAGAPAGA